MSRFLLSSAVALAFASGCAPSNPALVIDGILAAPTTCTFVATSTAFTLEPVLDTHDYGALRPLGLRYEATFRVTNRMLSLFNARYPLRAEPNVLVMAYAEVEIMQVDGTPLAVGLPNPYRVIATGTISPGSSAAGISGLTSVEVIPPIYGDALIGMSGRVLVSVRMTGTTSGGQTVTSGAYLFPLDLCDRCLVSCDASLMVTESTCRLGQDRNTVIGTDLAPGCVIP